MHLWEGSLYLYSDSDLRQDNQGAYRKAEILNIMEPRMFIFFYTDMSVFTWFSLWLTTTANKLEKLKKSIGIRAMWMWS